MRFFLSYFLLLTSLFGIETSTPDEISNLCTEPSALVGGYINVLTGDFVLRKNDLTVAGAVPLPCERYLCSRDMINRANKWELYDCHKAQRFKDSFSIQEENGVWIPYEKTGPGTWAPKESFFEKRASLRLHHNPLENRAEARWGHINSDPLRWHSTDF